MLPKVVDSAGEFGVATADILGAPVPVLGMAGDQQAATVGQACIKPGMVKATYGTGCFALLNTGSIAGALAATACSPPSPISSTAGAPMRWRAASSSPAPPCNGCATACSLIEKSADVEARRRPGAKAGHGVYMVPAFVGLGAPYWDAERARRAARA